MMLPDGFNPGPIIIGGNSPTIDGIFSLGPATNERQPTVRTLTT